MGSAWCFSAPNENMPGASQDRNITTTTFVSAACTPRLEYSDDDGALQLLVMSEQQATARASANSRLLPQRHCQTAVVLSRPRSVSPAVTFNTNVFLALSGQTDDAATEVDSHTTNESEQDCAALHSAAFRPESIAPPVEAPPALGPLDNNDPLLRENARDAWLIAADSLVLGNAVDSASFSGEVTADAPFLGPVARVPLHAMTTEGSSTHSASLARRRFVFNEDSSWTSTGTVATAEGVLRLTNVDDHAAVD